MHDVLLSHYDLEWQLSSNRDSFHLPEMLAIMPSKRDTAMLCASLHDLALYQCGVSTQRYILNTFSDLTVSSVV